MPCICYFFTAPRRCSPVFISLDWRATYEAGVGTSQHPDEVAIPKALSALWDSVRVGQGSGSPVPPFASRPHIHIKSLYLFHAPHEKKRYCSKRGGKSRSSLVRVVPLPGVCVRTSGESGCSVPISSGERFRIGQGILKANLHSLFSNRTARPQPFLLKRRMTCLREMEIDRAVDRRL